MEPFGYLDLPADPTYGDLSKDAIKEYARTLTDQNMERLLACLFRESADNPFKKKFKRIYVVSVTLLILSLLLLVWAVLIHANKGMISWQVYTGFGCLIAATSVAYLCRAVLRRYVQSVLESRFHTRDGAAGSV